MAQSAEPLITTGPALTPAPQQVSPPPLSEQLPVHTRPPGPPAPGQEPPRWWWLGCHGGAGATTLATTVHGGWEAFRAWPDPRWGGPTVVVLVCRSHERGMSAASSVIRQWLAGATPPVTVWGLVIMADAPGKLPKQLSAQRRRLAGTVEHTFTVPWVEPWRASDFSPDNSPRELTRLRKELDSSSWTQKGTTA